MIELDAGAEQHEIALERRQAKHPAKHVEGGRLGQVLSALLERAASHLELCILGRDVTGANRRDAALEALPDHGQLCGEMTLDGISLEIGHVVAHGTTFTVCTTVSRASLSWMRLVTPSTRTRTA
ncbi:MAG TPA: hypothetical protein VNM90_30580 [Haliangium sp.]|nr:hypothetical protein [Haliangium sp.]